MSNTYDGIAIWFNSDYLAIDLEHIFATEKTLIASSTRLAVV